VSDASQAGKIQKKPIENGGSDLKALGIFGLEHLDKDVIEIENEGPLLGDKGIKKVPIRISGPAMLIALKAWALKERTKSKDGYDVVWMLRASGVEALVQRYRSSGLLDTEFGTKALDSLMENFETPDHTGPKGWVLESKFEGENAALEARNAEGIVKEFVGALRS
jgi:hypothetical protein